MLSLSFFDVVSPSVNFIWQILNAEHLLIDDQPIQQTESRLDAKQFFLTMSSNVTRTLVFHKLLINMHLTMKFDSVELKNITIFITISQSIKSFFY